MTIKSVDRCSHTFLLIKMVKGSGLLKLLIFEVILKDFCISLPIHIIEPCNQSCSALFEFYDKEERSGRGKRERILTSHWSKIFVTLKSYDLDVAAHLLRMLISCRFGFLEIGKRKKTPF